MMSKIPEIRGETRTIFKDRIRIFFHRFVIVFWFEDRLLDYSARPLTPLLDRGGVVFDTPSYKNFDSRIRMSMRSFQVP
jgi:hypothetical protein